MAQMGLGRFRPDSEKKYLEERSKFIEANDKDFIADNPFLFYTRPMIQNTLTRIELYNKIKNVAGSIVECGVADGNNLMLFANLSMIHEPFAINRKIIGFDTFDGFRNLTELEKTVLNLDEKDFSLSSETIIQKSIELYDIDRPLGHMPRVEIVKGNAIDTIPEYVENNDELTIAMLYLDFDIYEPTAVALEEFLPLVAKGGIVAFDEFNYKHFSGETKAAKEMLDIDERKFKRFSYDSMTAYFRV